MPDVEVDGLDMPIMVGLCAGAGMAGIGVGEVRGFPRFSYDFLLLFRLLSSFGSNFLSRWRRRGGFETGSMEHGGMEAESWLS